MTDKEPIICKYKFQDKEKFDGKPYCTCFSELCEDLSSVCDDNCQIYEDYKQLVRKKQECEALNSEAFTRESLITLQEDYLQVAEQLITGILKTLNLEAYDWCINSPNEILMEIKTFKEKHEALKLENEEGYEIVDELKQECE